MEVLSFHVIHIIQTTLNSKPVVSNKKQNPYHDIIHYHDINNQAQMYGQH